MVEGDGIVELEVDLDRGTIGCANAVADRDDPVAGIGGHFGAQRAHGAGELNLFGDDVVRIAAVELGDGQNGGIERIGVARHDGLQRLHELAADHDRVDGAIRHGRMAAAALDGERELGRRRHDRARPDRELADRQTGLVVHAVNRFDGEPVHDAFFHHHAPAAATFFRRLEDHGDRAREVARFGQIFGGTQQHGRVPVVAASMHGARRGGRIGRAGNFGERQRIHVGA